MTTFHEQTSPSRRAILAAPLVLPAVVGATSSGSSIAGPGPASDTLVAFYSRTGNTRVIAGQIRRARGADIFEIRTVEPYPQD